MKINKNKQIQYRAVDENGWVFKHTYGIKSNEDIIENDIERLAYLVSYLYHRCYVKPEIFDEKTKKWRLVNKQLKKKFDDELKFRFAYHEHCY